MPKFEFVMETINNLQIPMLCIDGELYITQQKLEKMLGVTGTTIRRTYQNRKDEFDGNCVHTMNAIQYLKENKDVFGLKYIRGDMKIWSEDDMLTFSMLVRGVNGKRVRKELKACIKANARREYISKERYLALEAEVASLREKMSKLDDILDVVGPIHEELVKAAGKTLQSQKAVNKVLLN